ncbi:B type mitotic cyclin [Dunaliella salina]|uniref:B type mitotic cyclin n=1 Tax=Dunaliella salina TaxID=3046 RepID=A0ABQ7H989_DUNSA|nr:B type mitotic cyclin [Dunaliella salina]|eukprot:KAF5843420.1 B type mitotic cyclin [Dunaliella salina]
MATQQASAPENLQQGAAGGKAAKPGLQGGASRRRAPLGDVSNITAPVQQRVQGKEGKQEATKAANAAKQQQAVQQNTTCLAPRTRSQTARALQQGAAGMSMSQLLESRSEQACSVPPRSRRSSRSVVAPPPSPLPDIDGPDRMNPLAATEYVNDIYSYYKRVEHKFSVPADYMKQQADINEKMRAILIDWLVEVHLKFKLMPETLFLTVNLIDRFLALKPVTRRNLQLLGGGQEKRGLHGCSCLQGTILRLGEVKDFVYISDKAYTREQIINMEKLMLNTLGFNLTLPTPYNFLARFLKAAGAHLDKQVTMLASYLIELAQVDAGQLKYAYSLQSAAALYGAMRTAGKEDPYPRALAKHSGYSEDDVHGCTEELLVLMKKAPTASLNAVYKKYSLPKYLEVAKLEPCADEDFHYPAPPAPQPQ